MDIEFKNLLMDNGYPEKTAECLLLDLSNEEEKLKALFIYHLKQEYHFHCVCSTFFDGTIKYKKRWFCNALGLSKSIVTKIMDELIEGDFIEIVKKPKHGLSGTLRVMIPEF